MFAAKPSIAMPSVSDLDEYDAAFEELRDAPDALSGARAKDKWLMEYGLSPATLGAVWALADVTRNGKLDRFEHRLAMHLIQKVCCAGGELPAALPPAMLVASSDDAASRVRAVAEAVSLLPAGGEAAAPPPPSPPGVWALQPADLELYRRMFASADAAGRGRVTPAESQLSRSNLPPATLQQIWKLADVTEPHGSLDLHEFVIAVHTITRHLKRKLPLPDALPTELRTAAAQACGSPAAIAAAAAAAAAFNVAGGARVRSTRP